MEDPYAQHGRDKFLELLIDSFSKLNRRDFDRSLLIPAVPRSPWKLSVSTAMKNTSWRNVRCSYSGDRQTREPRKPPADPCLRRYSYAVDATCDLSSRWSYEFAFSSRTIDVASILFPMQSLIEISRTKLLGLFSTVLYLEFLRLLNIE